MLLNASCTVYRINGDGGYDRYYIPRCFWDVSHGYRLAAGGFVKDDSVIVQIPEQYAASAPRTPQKDMLVKGDCDFEFNNFTDESISASFREFKEKHKPATATAVEVRLYGHGLRHIEVTAK